MALPANICQQLALTGTDSGVLTTSPGGEHHSSPIPPEDEAQAARVATASASSPQHPTLHLFLHSCSTLPKPASLCPRTHSGVYL